MRSVCCILSCYRPAAYVEFVRHRAMNRPFHVRRSSKYGAREYGMKMSAGCPMTAGGELRDEAQALVGRKSAQGEGSDAWRAFVFAMENGWNENGLALERIHTCVA